MASWTKPFGRMIAQRGRVIGRSISITWAAAPAFRLDAFPFRLFQPKPKTNGTVWTAPGDTIDCTATHLEISEWFEKGAVRAPNEEIDALLRWFVDTWEGRIALTGVALRAIEHYEYDGHFPYVFSCAGNEFAWTALKELTLGTLQPTTFIDNCNFE